MLNRIKYYSCTRFAEQLNSEDVTPQTNVTQQMTTLSLTEEVSHMSFPKEDFQPDPFPNKTPTPMLSREFQLASLSLTQDQESIIFPLNSLLTQDYMVQYLKPFSFVRSGVKLRIVLTSDSTLYGVVSVSALPFCRNDSGWKSNLQQSQSNQHLLDISQQDSLDLHLPWTSPLTYAQLDQLLDLPEWRVIIKALVVLQPGEETPSVNINVFGSLDNPRAMGYTTPVFQASLPSYYSSERPSRFASALGVAGTAALTAGGTTLFNTIAGTAFEQPINELEPDGDQTEVRVSVMDNLTMPSASLASSRTMLGDCRGIPARMSKIKMSELARMPYLQDIVTFTSSNTKYLYEHQLKFGSHAEYLFRMFRYWRGSFNLMLRFYSSVLYGAKFRVTLYPTGYVAGNTLQDIAHLPTTVISVKGSLVHHVNIPYLQQEAWQSDVVPSVIPAVVVEFISVPPTFDGSEVQFPMLVYAAPGEDFELTSLQSCIPGTFQCSIIREFQSITNRGAPAPVYMASDFSVDDVLSRYSFRAPVPQQVFPGPLKITDFAVYEYDNFDYLCQIFMFYTGSLRMKMLFSTSPADGLLQLVVRNRQEVPQGDTFRVGNSMVASQQSLWPVLDAQVPYLASYPFNSIWEPLGQTNLQYSEEAVLSKLMVSRGHDFAVTCPLPIPDAYFQSYQRFQGRRTITFNEVVPVGGGPGVITRSFDPLPQNVTPSSCTVNVRIMAFGTTASFQFLWAINPSAALGTNTVIEAIAAGSGRVQTALLTYEFSTAVLFDSFPSTWNFVISTLDGTPLTVPATFVTTIFISPLNNISSLVSNPLPMEQVVIGRVGGSPVNVQPPAITYVQQVGPVQVQGTDGFPVYVSNYPNPDV